MNTARSEYRENCLNIQLTPDIYTEGNVLVCGLSGQGKSALLKNMAIQLCNKGTSITFVSNVPVFDKSDTSNINKNVVDVAGFVKIAEDLKKEMMNRFNMMDQQHVNHVFKLNIPVQPKVLIVDGFDFYMHSADYKSVDAIKQCLSSIARLGRPAAIMLVISCQRPSGNVISTDLYNNIVNRINVGKITDASESMLIFNTNVNINVPFGIGIYQNAIKSDADFSIFKIEDVKNF